MVCEMCLAWGMVGCGLAWGMVGCVGMRGLGLGSTNPVGTGGVWDVCLGCGGVVGLVPGPIPAHQRCTQYSILLHLMDICFLTCICLRQISQVKTFLGFVVRPELVLTSPAFMRSSSSGSAWLAKKFNWVPIAVGRRGRHNLHSGLTDSSTACRLCHLEPQILILLVV